MTYDDFFIRYGRATSSADGIETIELIFYINACATGLFGSVACLAGFTATAGLSDFLEGDFCLKS